MKYAGLFGFLVVMGVVWWQLAMGGQMEGGGLGNGDADGGRNRGADGNGNGEAAVSATRPLAPSGTPLPDEEVSRLMSALLEGDRDELLAARDAILAARDTRFIAVFLELFRASEMGVVRAVDYRVHADTLNKLSGQSFGLDWAAWVEWYGGTDLMPPPGFTGWKGQLLARIYPQFADFLYDGAPSKIRTEEIQWGGVVVDGIPALMEATMIPGAQGAYLEADEAVFGISINGDSRAYPLRILDWHEMANDVVGGVPVSLAYCTLCGAAIAYDGRASDGNSYTFGSSGFLFRSNKLMYDHQTRTLWNQFTGEPVLGKLAASDVSLSLLPVVLTTWQEWQAQHPDTLVLDLDTGYDRIYQPGAAYGDYFSGSDTMFPVWQRDDALPTKSQIYGLHLDGVRKAYPIETLAEEQVVNDIVGQTPVVLIASRGIVTIDGQSRRIGPVTYRAGSEVRAYERTEHTFSPPLRGAPTSDPNTVLDETGRPWQITEEALVGPEGETLTRLNGHLAYWFGWYAFFPQTELYAPSS
ncbi:MAG: DUF3179 domain-containing protein [Ardenticatenaceae bacterium]